MTSTSVKRKATIIELAERLQRDIYARGLKQGDPYLGQVEAKKLLSVSSDATNRAMRLLAQQGVIERVKGKGTFIAKVDRTLNSAPDSIRRVHIIVPKDMIDKEGFLLEGYVIGIQSELPDTEIVYYFLPQNDEGELVEDLVKTTAARSGIHAFVLIGSTFAAQKIMADSGLPTVVGGSLYPSIRGLAYVDADYASEAKKVANYLLERNCRRFLYLTRSRVLPGDQAIQDGLCKELSSAGIGLSELLIRHLPPDLLQIKASATEVLQQHVSRKEKLGIVARNAFLSRGVEEVADEHGYQFGKELDLVSMGPQLKNRKEELRLPYVHQTDSGEVRGKHVGQLLIRLVTDGEAGHVCLASELVCPKTA